MKIKEEKQIVENNILCKKCSDYDNDCVDVKEPITCWFGGEFILNDGKRVYLEKSDGYCPLLQQSN